MKRLVVPFDSRVIREARLTRSLRAAGLVLLIAAAAAGCGKKGPPLAPFVRVPAAVGAVSAVRIGGDMYVTFAVPATNKDGQQPADIASLEVYAVTAARPPVTKDERELATLIATIPVRPILPELPVPENGSPEPPPPLPPGIDRTLPAVAREEITPEKLVPVDFPDREKRDEDTEEETEDTEPEVFGPLVAPPPVLLPRRHYFVVGVSPRGRESDPSTPLSVPLETGSSAPGQPTVEYTETLMTITWTPPPDARTSTFLLPPPPPKPVNATPGGLAPKPPPPPPARIPARSLGFNSTATTYHVYAINASPAAPVVNASPAAPPVNASPAAPDEPYKVALPAPLTPAPVAITEHVIKGVTFGVEQCFEVRAVDQVSGATVIGPASPRRCLTPLDTFPPAAPRSLAVIAGAAAINLIWDANSEPDLAGYLVLRAAVPGDTLQPITKVPVAAATYRDETVKPGTRYVYAVVAVDRAGNRSPESNRMEETAR